MNTVLDNQLNAVVELRGYDVDELLGRELIQQYKDTKSRIKSAVVSHECEGHEHWRHQFFLALTHLENNTVSASRLRRRGRRCVKGASGAG